MFKRLWLVKQKKDKIIVYSRFLWFIRFSYWIKNIINSIRMPPKIGWRMSTQIVILNDDFKSKLQVEG